MSGKILLSNISNKITDSYKRLYEFEDKSKVNNYGIKRLKRKITDKKHRDITKSR